MFDYYHYVEEETNSSMKTPANSHLVHVHKHVHMLRPIIGYILCLCDIYIYIYIYIYIDNA